jgi:hypothetical protein
MPSNQFDKPFVEGLDYSPTWQVVFMNNKQRLYVNVATEKGRDLYNGMFTNATRYPDEFSANLSRGHNLLLLGDLEQRKRGLEMVIKSFEMHPSTASALELLYAAQSSSLRPRIDEVFGEYVDDFRQNLKRYRGKDGYTFRLEAARLASIELERAARAQRDVERAQALAERMDDYLEERRYLAETKRW